MKKDVFTVLIFLFLFIGSCFVENIRLLNFFSWGIYYLIGYIMCKYNVVVILKQRKIISLSIFTVMILAGIINLDRFNPQIVKLLTGVGVTGILIIIFANILFRFRILEKCGQYSLVIYMVHGFVNQIAWIATSFMGITILRLLVTTTIQLVVAGLVITMWKNRYLKWSKYIFYPNKLVVKYLK